jgi:hypothetical protein
MLLLHASLYYLDVYGSADRGIVGSSKELWAALDKLQTLLVVDYSIGKLVRPLLIQMRTVRDSGQGAY